MSGTAPFTFTDRKGRTWNVELDLQKTQLVDHSDFSEIYGRKFTLSVFDKDLIGHLFANSPLLFAIIWAIVQDQVQAKWEEYRKWKILPAAERGPQPTDTFPCDPSDTDRAQLEFTKGVNGKVVEAARQAFLESLSDFFQDHQNALSLLVKKHQKMKELMVEKLGEADKKIDRLLELEMDKAMAELEAMLSEKGGTTSTT